MSYRLLPILSVGVVLLLTVAPSPQAVAKEDEIPSVVLSGLKAYQADGAEAALKTWLVGSPMEGENVALSQANIFRQAETLYGKYVGFHLIKVVDLTPSTKLVYLQINYQEGPFFTNFVCYKTESGWIIPTLTFHTEAEKVIPSEILYAK